MFNYTPNQSRKRPAPQDEGDKDNTKRFHTTPLPSGHPYNGKPFPKHLIDAINKHNLMGPVKLPHGYPLPAGLQPVPPQMASNLAPFNNTPSVGLRLPPMNHDDDDDKENEITDCSGSMIRQGDSRVHFCDVPGRLALLNSNIKHFVSLAEVKRRIVRPEGMNLSYLGGYLRKAKNKNGNAGLVEELRAHYIHINTGRRKFTEPTGFTALTEVESQTIAKDYNKLNREHFPCQDFIRELVLSIQEDQNMGRMMNYIKMELQKGMRIDLVWKAFQVFFAKTAETLDRDCSVYRHRGLEFPQDRRRLPGDLQMKLEILNLISHDFNVRTLASIYHVLGGTEIPNLEFDDMNYFESQTAYRSQRGRRPNMIGNFSM